jgi:hypothetical protein
MTFQGGDLWDDEELARKEKGIPFVQRPQIWKEIM